MNRTARYVYTAVFTLEPNGAYSVSFPALDGCFTQGRNFEEAYAMAQDALGLHLTGILQDGEQLPEDHSISFLRGENDRIIRIAVVV